eukprot:gene38898-27870_t
MGYLCGVWGRYDPATGAASAPSAGNTASAGDGGAAKRRRVAPPWFGAGGEAGVTGAAAAYDTAAAVGDVDVDDADLDGARRSGRRGGTPPAPSPPPHRAAASDEAGPGNVQAKHKEKLPDDPECECDPAAFCAVCVPNSVIDGDAGRVPAGAAKLVGVQLWQRLTSRGTGPLMRKTSSRAKPPMRKTSSGTGPLMRKTSSGTGPLMRKTSSGTGPLMRKTSSGTGPLMRKTSRGTGPLMRKTSSGTGPLMRKTSRGTGPLMRKTSSGTGPLMRKTNSKKGGQAGTLTTCPSGDWGRRAWSVIAKRLPDECFTNEGGKIMRNIVKKDEVLRFICEHMRGKEYSTALHGALQQIRAAHDAAHGWGDHLEDIPYAMPPCPCRLCPAWFNVDEHLADHITLVHGGEDRYRERCWYETRYPRPPKVHSGPLKFDKDGLPDAGLHPREHKLYKEHRWKYEAFKQPPEPRDPSSPDEKRPMPSLAKYREDHAAAE